MEKSLSHWLVVSDIDGTLNTKSRTLPQRNYNAIARFVERGGNFTLASGRNVSSLKRHYTKVPCNVPAVVLNGAGIYDFNKNRMIVRNEISDDAQQFVRLVAEKFHPFVEIAIFFDDYAYIVKKGVLSLGQMTFDKTNHTVCDIDSVPKRGWCKVIFFANPITIKQIEAYSRSLDRPDCTFMESSIWSYEMLAANTHKGSAVMSLAAQLGIDKQHVAAIGDYYNDLDMLKSVGLPACAGQAPKDIKEICTLVACHCNDGCVADLLEYIMRLED